MRVKSHAEESELSFRESSLQEEKMLDSLSRVEYQLTKHSPAAMGSPTKDNFKDQREERYNQKGSSDEAQRQPLINVLLRARLA